MRLSAHVFSIPLTRPYVLSFGPVAALDTVYLLLEGKGRMGLGEVTPLPGYNHETLDSALAALRAAGERLARGADWRAAIAPALGTDPFAMSGLACAAETWEEGLDAAFLAPAPAPVPLAAFCAGTTPEEAARNAASLAGQGFTTLKLKVGAASPAEDGARVRAAAQAVPPGVGLRLDANQAYAPDQALALCRELEGVAAVDLLEQPFKPEEWNRFADLAGKVSLPLMLDESIWEPAHVRRAADCGARLVKFKLCKHPGLEGTRRMVAAARERGLEVVYGNGVQTVLGNHLEFRLCAELGLTLAAESNGFLKPAASPLAHRLDVDRGTVRDRGLGPDPAAAVRRGREAFSLTY